MLDGVVKHNRPIVMRPPFRDSFNGHFREAPLGEVMRQQLRLGRRGVGKMVAQNFGDAAVQHLTPALEQILISRILNERVLEPIVGFGRQALHQVSASASRSSAVCRAPPSIPATACSKPYEKPGPIAAPIWATSRAGPSRSSRAVRDCWSVGGIAWDAALLAALQQESRYLLDEQRHPAGALGHAIDHFLRQCVAGRQLADHVAHLLAVQRRELNRGVVRAILQGARNSGRAVMRTSNGARAPRRVVRGRSISAKARLGLGDHFGAFCVGSGQEKRPGRNPGPSISVEGGLNSPCRPCHHQA
jgi:hypothetical protein